MLLFVSTFIACLMVSPHPVHANCISDWAAQNQANGSITSQESSDIECVFGWFEATFPDVFYPASNTIGYGALAYRYYAGSNAFLGAWKTTSLKIVYLGPLSGNCIMELGTVDFWKTIACNIHTGITPGLWTGNNVQFFVSSDGSRITSTGSSIVKNGTAYSFVLGPNTFINVGYCGNINLTINTSGDDVAIVNNAFAFTTSEGMTIEGSFGSANSSSGTYSVNEYIPSCGGYAVGSGTWSATSFDSYSPARSAEQSNRHEIVTDNTISVIQSP